jgi:hypothetical protein
MTSKRLRPFPTLLSGAALAMGASLALPAQVEELRIASVRKPLLRARIAVPPPSTRPQTSRLRSGVRPPLSVLPMRGAIPAAAAWLGRGTRRSGAHNV